MPFLIFRSFSGRTLAAAWWSFCFVIVAMYIAHSMAHDTVLEKEILFNDVQELVEKTEPYGIKFGALKGGATHSFFKVLIVILTENNKQKWKPHINVICGVWKF